jgi:hypothetical protein
VVITMEKRRINVSEAAWRRKIGLPQRISPLENTGKAALPFRTPKRLGALKRRFASPLRPGDPFMY